MLFLFQGCIGLSFKNWTGLQDSKIVVMCILKILFILSGILKSDPVHPENPVWRILV